MANADLMQTSENVSVAVCTSKVPASITLAAGEQRTVYYFTAFAYVFRVWCRMGE